jgi:anion-transporting  ArsA/GET3 family ATPase
VSQTTRNIDRKFLFVTGKGGVGKSTVSVALARALADRGRRVLLAVTEQAQVGQMLGGLEITGDVQEVDGTLSVVWVDPERSLRDYGEIRLRSRLAYQALFGNKYAHAFLAAIPGLYQWAALGKAWFYADGERALGGSTFDHVVFDAPATGHGLEMLRVPKVITEASPPGVLRKDAAAAWDMLQDPGRTGVIVVALPEELPVQEALELATEVRELEVPLAALVMNAVPPPLFSEDERAQLRQTLPELSSTASQWASIALEHADASEQAATMKTRVASLLSAPVLSLPWVAEPDTPAGVAKLTSALRDET